MMVFDAATPALIMTDSASPLDSRLYTSPSDDGEDEMSVEFSA